MTQLSLLDPAPRRPAPKPEQQLQAERVSARIDRAIVDFCRSHAGQEVRMQQLTEAVAAAVDGHVAPDSPGRRFRALRVDGVVQARLVNRSSSLYRIDSVRG